MISYKQLLSGNQNIANLPTAIRTTAADICERRRLRGQDLEEKALVVRKEREQILKLIESLRENLHACKDEDVKSDIENLITRLEQSLNRYSKDLTNLARRFKNSKIRILSFGFKTQGKSLFTKLYTGITDDRIVSVKSNTNKDQTGATNVIHHNIKYKADAPHITVYFRNDSEVLNLINNALREVLPLIKGTKLPTHFGTYFEFVNYIQNEASKKEAYGIVESLEDSDNIVPAFDSAKSLLLSFFVDVSDFSHVGKKHLELYDPSELSTYNNMQDKNKQCYLSVDHIDIELDLQRENMFENFEICDTKGLSEDAGGFLIEDALIEDINRADAVFSIQSIQQGGLMDKFVSKLKSLSNPSRKNGHIQNLRDRHFSIANIHSDIETSDVENYNTKLTQNGLVHEVYAGMLVDGTFAGETIDAKIFANYLLLNMMKEIVNTTQSHDAALLGSCYEKSKEVNQLIRELKSLLLSMKIKAGSGYKDCILKNVELIRRKIVRQLIDDNVNDEMPLDNSHLSQSKVQSTFAETNPASDDFFGDDNSSFESNIDADSSSELDTSAYHCTHQTYDLIKAEDKSIYFLLTNHKNSDVVDWSVNKEVEQAIAYLLSDKTILRKERDSKTCMVESDFVTMAGVQPVGDVLSIGCVLDTLRYLVIAKKISNNIEKYRLALNPQKEKEIAQIYDVIFRELHLYDLFDELERNSFKGVLECNISNQKVQELCQIARELNLTDKGSYTWLPSSYKFIKEYFSLAPEVNSTDLAKSIIDYESVKNAFTNLMLECKNSLAAEIEIKDADGQSPLSICLSKVVDSLGNPTTASDLVDLYLVSDFSDDYLEKLEKWGLLTTKDKEEVRSGQQRDKLIHVIEAWQSVDLVTAVS